LTLTSILTKKSNLKVVIKRRNQSQKKKRKGVDLRDLKVNSEALFQISNLQEVPNQH